MIFACLLSGLLAASSAAQQTTEPAGQAPPSQEPDKGKNNDEVDKSKNKNAAIQKQEKTGTSNDRLFLPCRIF